MSNMLKQIAECLALNKLTLIFQETAFMSFGNYCDSVSSEMILKIMKDCISPSDSWEGCYLPPALIVPSLRIGDNSIIELVFGTDFLITRELNSFWKYCCSTSYIRVLCPFLSSILDRELHLLWVTFKAAFERHRCI